jgi:hypothetical protein
MFVRVPNPSYYSFLSFFFSFAVMVILLRKEKEYAIFLAAQTPKNNARVKNNYNEKTPIPKQVFFFFQRNYAHISGKKMLIHISTACL